MKIRPVYPRSAATFPTEKSPQDGLIIAWRRLTRKDTSDRMLAADYQIRSIPLDLIIQREQIVID